MSQNKLGRRRNGSFANNSSQNISAFSVKHTTTTTTTKPLLITTSSLHSIPTSTTTITSTTTTKSSTISSLPFPFLTTAESRTTTTSLSPSPSSAIAVSNKSAGNHGLSGSAIAGIVIGILCAVVLCASVLFFFIRKRRLENNNRISYTGGEKGDATSYQSNPTDFVLQQQQRYSMINRGNSLRSSHHISHLIQNPGYPSIVLAPPAPSPNTTTNTSENNYYNNNSIPDSQQQQQMSEEEEEAENEFWTNSPPIGTYTIVSSYTQTLDDELYIQAGDQVQVFTEYDDGWCLGMNLTRGSARGVFPQHCLDKQLL